MPTCLITGCGGFIGSHLAEYLVTQECRVVGTVHEHSPRLPDLQGKVTLRRCDITDRNQVRVLARDLSPDFVFHLAAQSLIPESWSQPELTLRTNVLGTLYLLEALQEVNLGAIVQVAGSSTEYGPGLNAALSESGPLHPMSPYAVSKAAAVHLSLVFAHRYGMRVLCVRPFQFIGPRKFPDACSDFARGIVEIQRGRRRELPVGNLDAVRDMLDVRDGVRAMWRVARSGRPGEVYNVCTGVGYAIRDVLEKMIALAELEVPVREDPTRLRPLDEPVIVGDNAKLRELGWEPEIPLERTLSEILDYWRGAID